ncbi:hypothetical protein J2787_002704 [Chryseobacterium rhizosphaerae]|uniref:Uncharacterized protein n=1 Tax=Chryseobacterium rhizosphaerae TaxID=395937 RepID=A0AAE4C3V0_9FLAO|nr:hypothetical protein [Chryseobacterium rhizosphaerae]MDR6527312.1 hypothetical protein [Chryseobacterium rhizosphaerae]
MRHPTFILDDKCRPLFKIISVYLNTMKILNLILALLLLFSCKPQKNLQGVYKTNKAEFGFFVTQIDLKNNNEFNYVFSGDLQHTELSGLYKISNHNLYLKFNKNKGEIESVNDSMTISDVLSGNYHNYNLQNENGISYHLKYKIQGNKLFAYGIKNGQLKKKSKVYTNQRKFLVFGSRWKNKRIYLKKFKS